MTGPVATGAAAGFSAAWIWLVAAGLLEIGWAIGLKETNGFTRVWPTILTVVGMILSFVCLAQAVRSLPIGTAYAVWTGIGTIGAAAIGMMVYREPATAPRIACITLIILGIIGLKLTAPR